MKTKLKCVQVEAGPDSRYDSQIVAMHDGTWKDAMSLIESALDAQFCRRDFDEISLKITCREMTEEEFNELVLEND